MNAGRSIDASGVIEVEVEPSAIGRFLCGMHHPIALNLGTASPWEPCCDNCMFVPQGHPSSWTWPA